MSTDKPVTDILAALQERAKELSCLYRVDEILSRPNADRDDTLREVLAAIPAGWQYPTICCARLVLDGRLYEPAEGAEMPWSLAAPVLLEGEQIGELTIGYRQARPPADEGPFLKDERRLINAIVERIGYWVMQQRLRRAVRGLERAASSELRDQEPRWAVILDFLRGTDRSLLLRITRRMINHLCVNGVEEAEQLLQQIAPRAAADDAIGSDDNRPLARHSLLDVGELSDRTFDIAARELSEDGIITRVQQWIVEEKAGFLYEALENLDTSLSEISEAVMRYRALHLDDSMLPRPVRTGIQVALLRRFFSENLEFIRHAKDFADVDCFYDLVQHTICPPRGHGRLGGKSAGLFVAANIVRKSVEFADTLASIRVPKTWYLTSDANLLFIRHNKMEDVYNCKYREIDQVRLEYPHLVHVFKNSSFPSEIAQGLSVALDDFENRPIIVRSSSLLEDQSGASFSGKYKSLFLANQGDKKQRLEALKDAIAEVYASVFGPDPIEYRAEHGLLDVHEEMGIMIQEVVGRRIGRYFLPVFSGVAFSNNEFRWSARIKREDGLVRLVPGLGTRAVDRLVDDYPTLLAPGQPGLRANQTVDEVVRYSPRMADVINLETNRFETVQVRELLRECGRDLPMVRQLVSVLDHDHIRRPDGLGPDFERDELVVTFAGLFDSTPFIAQVATLLRALQEKLGTPVDIEFAHDGEALWLLQCRPQSYGEHSAPTPIPRDLPPERVLFTANRYISNGRVPDVTHVVYVDPEGYEQLTSREQMKAVGRAVGRLNMLLPKRQFILMGPGRWGSRGDIRMGVSVTYSDISNTSMLIEIARQKGGYVPDLSFGTHFFQDLVESGIRYLPLYPDDPGTRFDQQFLRGGTNMLPDLLPEYEELADVVRVIDVTKATGGKIVQVLMNADLDEAIALFGDPTVAKEAPLARGRPVLEATPDEHTRWRLGMAERIAQQLDAARFGVKGVYVFGSTKNATAGPRSDLDLIVHFVGTPEQRRDLCCWLEGWSQALAETNFLRTGFRSDRLLDVHLVTDEDIARQSSYAAKIGARTDAARPLLLRPAGRGHGGSMPSSDE
jgi:hypothetical protein